MHRKIRETPGKEAPRNVKLALATCRDLPDWEVDDRALHGALTARGAKFDLLAWDDPEANWKDRDAVLIRTTWDYMDRREAYVDWAKRVDQSTPLFNPPDAVEWSTHKGYLRTLESAGIPVAPTEWLMRGATVSIAEILRRREWPRGFIKPAIGATARETLRFDANPEGIAKAQAHVDRLLREEDLLLQPYFESVEREGERSVILVEGEPTHAVRKIPVPGDYRVQDDFGASDEPIEIDAELLDIARRASAAAPGDLLYARADFLTGNDGEPLLTELEIVEPSMFFRHKPEAAEKLADALLARISQ